VSPHARELLDPAGDSAAWTWADKSDAIVAAAIVAMLAFLGGFDLGTELEHRRSRAAAEAPKRAIPRPEPADLLTCTPQGLAEYREVCKQRQRLEAVAPKRTPA
jgi:hypothetical protein